MQRKNEFMSHADLSIISISKDVIAALEEAITLAVSERIETDLDCDNSYLRIDLNHSPMWQVSTHSIEDNFDGMKRDDVPLIGLMWDSCDRELFPTGQAQWIPDQEAIRHLAESYRQLIAFKICLN